MAAMSVIGIDFGNQSCYVAVARSGGIETIANDYSLRATPSHVAFSGRNRIIGVAAEGQMVTNMKNTIYGFKRILGRKYNDPYIQQELQSLTYKTSQQPDGSIGIHVQYLGEDHVFSPEQITAMLFTKLKTDSEKALQTAVNDCVISVPSYFTQAERQALYDAARIAGLNVLRLFNETTAIALCYGIYKQDLPAPEGAPRNVAFVDCGYTSLQVCIGAFHKGKLKMLSSAADSQLGGRDIDAILADDFCTEFQKNYGINARNNPRAHLRLLKEVEKLKRQMSANSTSLPLKIECFMDDKDVHSNSKRENMEAMCAHLFHRVKSTLEKCLEDSKLKPEDIHSVEIVGGSSRVPAIKKLIEEVFGKTISTTLNQDEAVARGCALQCAMISPAVRVREFAVTDIQPYALKLTWDPLQGEDGEMEVFEQNHPFPFSKMLTFYRSNPFSLTANYSTKPQFFPETKIGTFTIKNVKPSTENESSRIKVKVRINLNGIFTVSSAVLVEKRESTQQEKEGEQQNMEVENNQDKNSNKTDEDSQENEPPAPEVSMDKTRRNSDADKGGNSMKGSTPSYSSRILSWFNSGEDKSEDAKTKKKVPTRMIELPIEATVPGYTQTDLDGLFEQECKMIAGDKQESERIDSLNALEEYIYYLRDKLNAEDQLMAYVTEDDRKSICEKLSELGTWLYEEGEECEKQVFTEHLSHLKSIGEPIKERKQEYVGSEQALDELYQSLLNAMKELDGAQDPTIRSQKYSHVTDEQIETLYKLIREKKPSYDKFRSILNEEHKKQKLPFTAAQIRAEKSSLDKAVVPFVTLPKPKVEPPPKDKPSEDEKSNENSQGDAKPQDNKKNSEEKMDVE